MKMNCSIRAETFITVFFYTGAINNKTWFHYNPRKMYLNLPARNRTRLFLRFSQRIGISLIHNDVFESSMQNFPTLISGVVRVRRTNRPKR